ncbi:unnamed protein product [Malus baccata var. baccata]
MAANTAHESLLLHSYKRSFNGFAARLTEEKAQKLAGCLMNPTLIYFSTCININSDHCMTRKIYAGMDGVVSVFPSETKKLQTTSLPYPKNSSDILSPRDTEGHGTHTASTAAGNLRRGAISTHCGVQGSNLKTITNFAPWSLAVAASTIDRHFDTKVELGNHKIYEVMPNRHVRQKIGGGNPTTIIWKSTEGRDTLAPYVPSFSLRGPNPNTPNILKPPIPPVSGVEDDDRVASYNIISGTSMACPHAAGVAAYVKSFHPNWSPATILSAFTTTAEFAYGAGLINPSRAPYPGLVYDATEIDYVNFLCAHGYSTRLLKALIGDSCSLSQSSHGTLSGHLNYPSVVALSTSNPKSVNGIFNRTVTNVGSPKSTYKAKVNAPPGLEIKVNPSVLKFTSLWQELSFQVMVKGLIEKTIVSGSLVWDDGNFQVRSPIVMYFVI